MVKRGRVGRWAPDPILSYFLIVLVGVEPPVIGLAVVVAVAGRAAAGAAEALAAVVVELAVIVFGLTVPLELT